VLDTQKYLPHDIFVENYGYYKDPVEADIYDKMLREVDPAKQRVLMRAYEKQIVDTEAHEFPMLWWERIILSQSYVKGWKIGPSHYINQDLANIWLDKPATH
jgi:peptide/nickel transport system substrate-binding protein